MVSGRYYGASTSGKPSGWSSATASPMASSSLLAKVGLLALVAAAGVGAQGFADAAAGRNSTVQQAVTSGPVPAIVNGQRTQNPGWAAVLRLGRGACGASLISGRWLVTAAHCVGPDWNGTVLVNEQCGPANLDPTTGECKAASGVLNSDRFYALIGGENRHVETPPMEKRRFNRVFVHPLYYTVTTQNSNCSPVEQNNTNMEVCVENPYDVAVIELELPTVNKPVIGYSCNPALPCVGGPNVVSLGWGLCYPGNTDDPNAGCYGVPTSDPAFSFTIYLQTTGPNGVPVVPNAQCGSRTVSADFCLKGSNGNGPAGTWRGDSGGPNVILTQPNSYTNALLVGITSWGPSRFDLNYFYSGQLRTGSVCDFIASTTQVQPSNLTVPGCPQPTCTAFTPGAQFDASKCASGSQPGTKCTVACVSNPAVSAQFTCTFDQASGTSRWTGALPQCPAPPVTRRCGTLNIGSRFDTSACANIPMWGKCKVKCAGGGSAVSTYTCTNVLVYIGVPPSCSSPPIRPPTSSCNTPWGIVAANSSKRVPCDQRYCAASYRGKWCGGMWVTCGANGPWSVQCIY